MLSSSLMGKLDARDRALFSRWTLTGRQYSRLTRWLWVLVTHCGGVAASLVAAVVPLWLPGDVRWAATRALAGLLVSHLIVQIIKRHVSRRRPSSVLHCETLVDEPPCFSFPSGHATASMSVAFIYAVAFPRLAVPLLLFSTLVGFSRVRLGVHYPGDVLAGQLIALATDAAFLAWR
jgi:undecaprenyl-diphosphatase